MRVHWLQHAELDGPGSIAPWLVANQHEAHGTRPYANEPLPEVDDFDALIVLGGPMNIYQHDRHPWLAAEKRLIRSALDAGKRLLGLCLGAQLIADQLGGKVTRNPEPEVGWHRVTLTEAGRAHPLCADLPPEFDALHWHWDRYALPPGATRLAHSEACSEQGFVYDGGRVLAWQFHPEITADTVAAWLHNDHLPQGRHIQPATQILAATVAFEQNTRHMHALLARVLR